LACTYAFWAGFLAKFLIWRLRQLQRQNKIIVISPKPSVIEKENIHDGMGLLNGMVRGMAWFVEWHVCGMARLWNEWYGL
jgi:hypothetical protein